MGKKTPKIPVDDYYMSIHYGVALTVDEIREIKIDDKVAWSGVLSDNATIALANNMLFGGDQKQGGISGRVDVLFGGPLQLFPEHALDRFTVDGVAATQANMPAYRGLTSLLFTGFEDGDTTGTVPGGLIGSVINAILPKRGFKWGSNNPVTPPVSVRAIEHWETLGDGLGVITFSGVETTGLHYASNPAHVIYGLVTGNIGSGMSPSQLDVDSFEEASQTLYDEGFGISAIWTRENEVEEFVRDILTHINGVIFIDPTSGLLTLDLIRDDYDQEALPTYGEDELIVDSWDVKSRGEMVSEVTVNYTNPINREEESVKAFDMATANMQNGEIVASSSTYHMIPSADLAAALAERDLRTGAAPLHTGKLRILRSVPNILPGRLFVLDYSDGDIVVESVVVRINEVQYGALKDEYLEVTVTEDIFALPKAQIEAIPPSQWIDPEAEPDPLDFQAAFTLPYALAALVPDSQLDDGDYPDVIVGLLGDQTNTNADTFIVTGPDVNAAGEEFTNTFGQRPLTDRTTLQTAVDAEGETASFEIGVIDRATVEVGDLFMIGVEDEDTSEMVMVLELLGSNAYRVSRGMLDTTPREWAVGASVWHIGDAFDAYDSQPRVGGVEIDYKLLPFSSGYFVSEDDATALTYTPEERPYLPTRPANVQVDGTAFGEVEYDPEPSVVPVTWSNRNRLTEDAVLRSWTEANVTPESGQETLIEVLDATDTVVASHEVPEGDTSFDIPIASFGTGSEFRVKVSSQRDGLVSYQGHEITVRLPLRSGYGAFYGEAYGA